jgi:hypothetical protein
MATLNYTQRLTNLQNRRFDRDLNESLLSKSFSSVEIPDNVKYLAESMRPIDSKSTDRTLEAASRVQKHLEAGFKLHFNRQYRTQGSVKTNTHIKASDFDFLTIIDRYHFNAPGIPVENPYTESNPDDDIKELRRQATRIMKDVYDEVDDSGEKNISIFNKSLNRKVDIVFCFWFHGKQYIDTGNEYYRGVKFKSSATEGDFPFAHMSQVNTKGDNTSDGSRRGIRLLKNLRADCSTDLEVLKGFHLTTIVHPIANSLLHYTHGNEINIAKAVSEEMGKILQDADYRKNLTSPNGMEKPLHKDETVPEIKLLKEDLDTLIEDASKEVLHSRVIQKALLTY